MRGVIATCVAILLAACAGPSPEEQVADLEADVDTLCLRHTVCFSSDSAYDINEVVTCMNDALANGSRAEAYWQEYSPKGRTIQNYVFTVDHAIRPYARVPDDYSGGPAVMYEYAHCTGPFRAANTFDCPGLYELAWDGCP